MLPTSVEGDLLRTVVDKSHQLVLIHLDGKILYANHLMSQFLYHPGGEFVEHKELKNGKKYDPNNIKTTLFGLSHPKGGFPDDRELHLRCFDGTEKYFSLTNTVTSYNDKKAVITILEDITERKNIESLVQIKLIETENRIRRKISSDLHDDLGPLLSSIKIHLGLEENLTDPSKYLENTRICNDLLKEAIEKIHLLSDNIMTDIIENYGLDEALKSFLKNLHLEKKLKTYFTPSLHGQRFSKEIEIHIFRIISELINNSIKHSGATKANLRLRYNNNCLLLLYADNGKGYDVEEILRNQTGMGIPNLYYRVSLIGGEIDFLNKSGKTYVRIRKKFR